MLSQQAESDRTAPGQTAPDQTAPDQAGDGVLSAPLTIEFPFQRTTGPVIGAFFTGLTQRVVVGIRGADGRVLCPPQEYDPVTSEPLTELVQVGEAGEVLTWTWVREPREGQPFDRPFAWAQVRLDGADTPLLHALDVAGPDDVHTGMRVQIRWAAETTGTMSDIVCFEPTEVPA